MLEYELLQPRSLQQALGYLEHYQRVKMIAGGTDLLVEMHKGRIDDSEMDYLLDISGLEELQKINRTETSLELGALVTHTRLIEDERLNRQYSLLGRAARTIGSTQIRNRATLGGNLINASPAADLVPPLIALGAEAVVESKRGQRLLTIEELITGPYQTDLEPGEMLTRVRLPLSDMNYYTSFQKIQRRQAVAIARLNLAVVARVDREQVVREIRIVPGSATPSPQAFSATEALIKGRKLEEIDPERLGKRAAEEMVEITGQRWSTPYKKPALTNLIQRALKAIMEEVAADAAN